MRPLRFPREQLRFEGKVMKTSSTLFLTIV